MSDSINNKPSQQEGERPDAAPESNMNADSRSAEPAENKRRADIVCNVSRKNDNALSAGAPAGDPGAMQPVMSASDIAKSVLRHKLVLALIFIVIAAPVLFLIWTQIVPKYQAQAQIRVRPIIPYLVFKTEDNGAIPLYDSYLQTQSSIIKTDTVLQRVLDLPEIKKTQWYINPPQSLMQQLTKTPSNNLENLKKSLSATPVKNTELINISFTDTNPAEAQLILNSVLDQYTNYIAEMTDSTQDKIYDELVNQYNSLDTEIQGREKVTAELRQQLGTSNPEELISGQRVRLDEAQARLTEVQQNIKTLEWEIQQTTSDFNDMNNIADTNDSMSVPDDNILKKLLYYQDTEWCRLDENAKIIQNEITNSKLTEKNPDYIKMQDDLAFAKDLLAKRQEQLDLQLPYRRSSLINMTKQGSENFDVVLEYKQKLRQLQYDLGKAKFQEQLLDADYKAQQKMFESLFSSAQSLETENTTIEHRRDLFTAVRQRLEQKTMERKVPGSIEVLSRAAVSGGPYQDRRMMLSLMALFFALGLGSAAAFLQDRSSDLIAAISDLPYPMQMTLLGVIPKAIAAKSSGFLKSASDRAHKNWPEIMDSVRIVRAALLSRLENRKGTTILVTSSAPGVDKTNFTMMLSASLSHAGKKVLVIDADFQKMTLSNQCKDIPEQHGFIQAMRENSNFDLHIFRTDMPGLYLLPAGTLDDKNIVIEEISDDAFRGFLNAMSRRYDVILMDGAPVLPKADTAILSSQMDGTIFVEREFVSKRKDTLDALARLASSGGRLLGTVMIGSEN
jgi:succinoglycan biosynthesis transport protein ExoP